MAVRAFCVPASFTNKYFYHGIVKATLLLLLMGDRCNHRRCSIKKVFLEISQDFVSEPFFSLLLVRMFFHSEISLPPTGIRNISIDSVSLKLYLFNKSHGTDVFIQFTCDALI